MRRTTLGQGPVFLKTIYATSYAMRLRAHVSWAVLNPSVVFLEHSVVFLGSQAGGIYLSGITCFTKVNPQSWPGATLWEDSVARVGLNEIRPGDSKHSLPDGESRRPRCSWACSA